MSKPTPNSGSLFFWRESTPTPSLLVKLKVCGLGLAQVGFRDWRGSAQGQGMLCRHLPLTVH